MCAPKSRSQSATRRQTRGEREKEREVGTQISSCPGPRALGFKVPVRADERRGTCAWRETLKGSAPMTIYLRSCRDLHRRFHAVVSHASERTVDMQRYTHARARAAREEKIDGETREEREKSQVRRREREREKKRQPANERTNEQSTQSRERAKSRSPPFFFSSRVCVCVFYSVLSSPSSSSSSSSSSTHFITNKTLPV